jgi:hypothetical protein
LIACIQFAAGKHQRASGEVDLMMACDHQRLHALPYLA